MRTETAQESEYEATDALVAGSGLPLDDLGQCRATQFVTRDGHAIVAMVLELPQERA